MSVVTQLIPGEHHLFVKGAS
jgi:P-type Ca2+ transporter type 2B